MRSGSAAGDLSGPAWLLPQRVARFDDFLERFSSGHRPAHRRRSARISPPWTYRLLAVLSAGLLAGELLAFILQPP